MLYCVPAKKRTIVGVERREDALWLQLECGRQKLVPIRDGIVRVLFTEKEAFSDEGRREPADGLQAQKNEEACMPTDSEKPGILGLPAFSDWTYEETETAVFLRMKSLSIRIDRESNQFCYYDEKGELLLAEREERSKELEEVPVYRMDDTAIEKTYVDTPDGRKEVVREAAKIQTGTAYHTRLHLRFGKEALYGLGQHEEGYGSLRGKRIYLHQANRKIAIPMLVSTKGYGILLNTYAAAIFSDTEEGSYLYTETDPEMDFFFLYGAAILADSRKNEAGETEAGKMGAGGMEESDSGTGGYALTDDKPSAMDGVIRGYRMLTGKAVLLPKWAYGYWQSQERYETQEEILSIAKECRGRGIGLDCIVLDWCSWPEGQWGQKTFDPERFPNVKAMTEELHEGHVHFMVSIWPNLTPGTENYEEFREKGLLLPGINNYNPLAPEGRKTYWKQVERGLFCHGVDAWWCDNSEPFTPEWNTLLRPESAKSYEEYCRAAGMHLPATKTNAYGFYHAQALYEGQRGYYDSMRNEKLACEGVHGEDARHLGDESHLTDEEKACLEKRVVNLTRSGYLGQQRFGAVLWSGDISASWETLKRQIAAGLHFCASGLPYWTVDIGAFFVKNGLQWFWDGKYDQGPKDPAYCELFTRWYQWGAFLPIFRGHGTDFRRELWEFDRPEAPFYQALLKANRVRYELMPYIYSLAGSAYLEDASIMKPLAFGFSEDRETWGIKDQYLFGDAIMICPVTEAFYFGADKPKKLGESCVKKVYLPTGCGWYDYWTESYYEGGQWILADAPLERIPVFVKTGSILPQKSFALSVEEQTEEMTICIYSGRDGEFLLYEDAGDGYAYEKGDYQLTKLQWLEKEQKLLWNGQATDKDCLRIIRPI